MSSPIVQKVWSFCNTLRDDGVGYGDYLEQLTYSFLKWLMNIPSRLTIKNSLFLKNIPGTH